MIGELMEQVAPFRPFEAVGGTYVEDAPPMLPRGTLRILETYARLAGERPCRDALAGLVLVLLAVAEGNSCLELDHVARFSSGRLPSDLETRSVDEWVSALEGSAPLVAAASIEMEKAPLILDGKRLYLERYYDMELAIARAIASNGAALGRRGEGVGEPIPDRTASMDVLVEHASAIERAIADQFPDTQVQGVASQLLAAQSIVTSKISVIAGGPGSGKTTTVAKCIVALFKALGEKTPIIRLAAPTGKAATRMLESLRNQVAALGEPEVASYLDTLEAVTLHRLLGLHAAAVHRSIEDKLPAEIVICDETSMTALPLLAELFGALRHDARVAFVGDPAQLRSVEVGTVMDDLVGDTQPGGQRRTGAMTVTVLDGSHRAEAPELLDLFAAVRRGDVEDAIVKLRDGATCITWKRLPDEPTEEQLHSCTAEALETMVDSGRRIRALATNPATPWPTLRAALVTTKVLAATHRGVLGRIWWTEKIAAAVGISVGSAPTKVGTPVLVTKNDAANGLFNGDTGSIRRDETGTVVVTVDAAGGPRNYSSAAIGEWLPWWAMTIHKSQGSEFDHVVVTLPPGGSRVVTRELLYTGLTRAKRHVTVIATEASIREAIASPAVRASGLKERIWGT